MWPNWKKLLLDVGTRQDSEAECGQKPLGEFVREIVGMDMNAAKSAFGEYLAGVNLDNRQIYFANQIVEYIAKNDVMNNLSVLQVPPFTDLSLWARVRHADSINANAAV